MEKHEGDKGWLEYSGKRYWVGTADALGLLIYDPEAQGGVRANRVNLFIVNQGRTASFVVAGGVKDIIRAVEPATDEHATAVAEYAEAAESRPSPRYREAHCWRCKERLTAAGSTVCERCRWMECSCGACGCNFGSAGGLR